MTKKMQDALNIQCNAELESFYIYLAMANYLENKGYKGSAHWMSLQADEEYDHYKQFSSFISDVEGSVSLEGINKPTTTWNTIQDVFESGLAHEKTISKKINALVSIAKLEKDYSAENFLQGFVTEQVEEEVTFRDILTELNMIKDNSAGLLMFDKGLGNRSQIK